MKIILFDAIYLLTLIGLVASWYLFRPLRHHAKPATFNCLKATDGKFKSIRLKPKHIFAVGLSYAQHIDETAHEFDPIATATVFLKEKRSLIPGGGSTEISHSEELIAEAAHLDPALPGLLRQKFADIPPLMDYEVELGFILLENISDANLADPDYKPKLGFFIANDLSARSLQILGEGMPNRLDYWGLSKSLADFLPTTTQVWVPYETVADAIPCVTLETRVNGEIRQSAKTDNMIYTPKQMLVAARQTYPNLALTKGDLVIMGTPGGIALSTPRFKARLAALLRFDRFTKLRFILKGDRRQFLKAGDTVSVSGEWLGEVTTRME